ncbi:uncharacterized protein [Leptinotarsa decemlineata]|uniref:uncharacterized protein n=1 Tax=Leptinotarsa decemlineata TaxID=7539 RepID=UPI003D306DB8
MKYLNYYLVFALWVASSVDSQTSDEPYCTKEQEFYWFCHNIQPDLYSLRSLLAANSTLVRTLAFNNLKGKFDVSILANFSQLRGVLIYNSTFDFFQIHSKSLNNIYLSDSTFPSGTKFSNCCAHLEKLTIKNTVGLNLQTGAFTDFRRLKKLYLSNQQIPRITSYTFKGLRSLKKLSLTNTTTTAIESDAFEDLTRLKEFYLEDDTLQTIESNVFKPLRRLTTLTIYGENLKSLSLDMFSKQRGLTQIGLPLSTWRMVDVETIPRMFPKLYAYSYIGEWKNADDEEYIKGKLFRLSQLLLDRQ